MDPAPSLRLIRFSAGAATIAWTTIVVVSFAAFSSLVHRAVVDLAVVQARESYEKDRAYRRWAASQGGVYVPVSPHTPPNPYLQVPGRDLITTDGRRLTLVNPAYMTRQVLDADRARRGETSTSSRITSARPIRPENGPDPWEAVALARLAAGAAEVTDEVEHDDPALRYMGRLDTEAPCVGCHQAQGARLGDLRGGISVHVPLGAYFAVADGQALRIGLAHVVVWVLGLCGILVAGLISERRAQERERTRAEREALEAELAHARRLEAMGRLAGGVAHDLNNLLSPILGNAQLGVEQLGEGAPLRDELIDIADAAQRAKGLTQQLLAFGRKQVLTVEPLDAPAALDELLPIVRSLAGPAIEVRAVLPRGLPAVRADRAQLGAAILNLVANARDAMPGGGVLTIAAESAELGEAQASRAGVGPGAYVAITVRDTGAGMDAATRARLFEPFFTTKASGHGLGLASAHGTVRQLGGAIEVESAAGQGSTFRVLLPATPEVPAPGPVPLARSGVPRGTETLLLVEDDEPVRRMTASVLSGLGYEVLAAAGADEAVALVRGREGQVAALVSDLQMPRVDGYTLHVRLSAIRPGLPVVFMTGYPGGALGPEAAVPPGAAVVAKPFTIRDLGLAVRRVLDAAGRPGQAGPSAASRSCADSHSA